MSADHLFYVSRANIFSVYPKILKELLLCEELARVKESLTGSQLVNLPSDFEWQMRMYFRLLDQQKLINAAVEKGEMYYDPSYKHNKVYWESSDTITMSQSNQESFASVSMDEHGSMDSYAMKKRKICISDDLLSYCKGDEVSLWASDDFAKAGMLLMRPPRPVTFVDEYEMRKVYSLIYDVYRYKLVLSQTLKDIGFFAMHPQMASDTPRVWLLLFELYCRKFMKRDPEATKIKDKLFAVAELLEIEALLWDYKTKLAASITRLRIQSNALVLAQLLPRHLQDNKVALAVSSPILTGWVNNFQQQKTKRVATVALAELGMQVVDDTDLMGDKLGSGQYKWDKVCTQFLTMYPPNRSDFVKSDMIRNSEFIIQDRAFSIGPSIFARMLDRLDLRGDLVQTHIFSPRSTAYLASLIMNNDRVNRFIVFGAGSKLEEYRRYMKSLGVHNITMVAESFTEISNNSNYLQKCVGIFATPPSSFSGISDPIDLICSRGGDLSMLEVLSESEMTDDGQKRVFQVLTEQRETLKKSMSRPYVQFIVYETHSIVQCENEEMVSKTIEFMNRKALDKAVRVFKEREKEVVIDMADNAPTTQPATDKGSNKRVTIEHKPSITDMSAESGSESEGETGKAKLLKKASKAQLQFTEEDYAKVVVPNTDLFESVKLPDLCKNRDKCLNLATQGCYIALMQRKEVVRLDSKYLIKMAEVRGIFGDADKKKLKSSTQKRAEKKAEELKVAAEEQNKQSLKRSKSSNIQDLITRINTATHASSKRGHLHRISTATDKFLLVDPVNESFCPRLLSRHSEYVDSSVVTYMQMVREREVLRDKVRDWWQTVIRHLIKLRAQSMGSSVLFWRYAALQPLHLQRPCPPAIGESKRKSTANKVPYPLPVSNVVFDHFNEFWVHCSPGKEKKREGAKKSRSVNEPLKTKCSRPVWSTVSY